MRDPKVVLRLGGHAKRIGIARLSGVVVFAGFGALFIALALTGNSDTAPGFQKAMGSWMREVAAFVDGVPNVVALPVLLALVGGFLFAILKKGGGGNERQEGESLAAAGARVRAGREG